MTQKQFISFFFIALLLFILWQIFLILSPFFKPIFWAVILSFAFYPLHEKLRKRLKKHENTAAILITLLIFLTFVPLAVFIVTALATEVFKFYEWVGTSIQDGSFSNTIEELRSLPLVQKLESYFLQWDYVKQNLERWLTGMAKNFVQVAARQAGLLTKNLFVASGSFLLSIFLVFFFLRDGNKILRFIYAITPLEEDNKKLIFHQIHETFAAVIHGQILTALTQSAAAGIIFWALGIPLPIFFAAITFFTSLIPVLGASMVWLPLVVYLLSLKLYTKAAILFVLGIGGISLIDNFLKPVLIGEKTKLPYLLLFLGILGGMHVYGLVGLFLAPAILSLFFVLIRIYRKKFLR